MFPILSTRRANKKVFKFDPALATFTPSMAKEV
jgi:hypothetical protein